MSLQWRNDIQKNVWRYGSQVIVKSYAKYNDKIVCEHGHGFYLFSEYVEWNSKNIMRKNPF